MLSNMSFELKRAVQNLKSRSETDQKVVQYPDAEPARPSQKGLSVHSLDVGVEKLPILPGLDFTPASSVKRT
jgi:hypothetical protein